jgi:hypothetical protein
MAIVPIDGNCAPDLSRAWLGAALLFGVSCPEIRRDVALRSRVFALPSPLQQLNFVPLQYWVQIVRIDQRN